MSSHEMKYYHQEQHQTRH